MCSHLRSNVAPGLLLVIVLSISGCDQAPEQQALDPLLLAERALSRGDRTFAITTLENLVHKDSSNSDAHMLLGRAFLEEKEFFKARKHLERAIDLGARQHTAYVALGTVLLSQKDYTGLLEQVPTDLTLRGSPKVKATIFALRGHAYLALSRLREGHTSFQAATYYQPGNSEALLGLAVIAEKRGALQDAYNYANAAVINDPNNSSALFALGRILRRQSRSLQAKDTFGEALLTEAGSMTAHLGLASAELALGHVDQALENIKKARDLDSDDLNALYLFAVVMFQKGNLSLSQKALNRVLEVQPDHDKSNLLLAAIYFQQQAYDRATIRTQHFLDQHPRVLSANHLLTKSLTAAGKGKEAFSSAQRAFGDRAGGTKELLVLAESALAGGQLKQAKNYLLEAQDGGNRQLARIARTTGSELAGGWPDRAQAHLASALDEAIPVVPLLNNRKQREIDALVREIELLRSQGKYDNALSIIRQRLRSRMPDNPLPYNLAGEMHIARQDWAAARSEFDTALVKSPADLRAQMHLAALSVLDRDLDDARMRYDKVLSQAPTHIAAMQAMAAIEISENKLERAESWLERARETAPTAIVPHIALSNLHLMKKDFDGARSIMQGVFSIYPQHLSVLQQLATIEVAADAVDSAIEYFGKIAELTPGSANSYFQIGVLQNRIGEVELAREAFQKALALKPEDQGALTMLTSLEIQSGQADQAVELSRRLQKSYPRSATGYALEGDAHMAGQEYQQAADAYQRAYDINPSEMIAFRTFLVRLQLGQGEAALELLQQWIKQNPEDVSARLSLGNAYRILGKEFEAAETYHAILDIAVNDAAVLHRAAVLLAGRGNVEAALWFAEAANRARPNNAAIMDTLGWLLSRSGENSRSLDLLRSAALANPHNLTRRYHLGAALAQTDEKSVAIRLLRDVLKTQRDFPEKQKTVELLSALGAD